jgi:quercetin dioxygenase-like cupin family protein
MLDTTATKFSHVKPEDTGWRSDGLRDFFLYKDLGVADATQGKVIAHLVKANMAPEKGTGWHRHEAEFQIVIMTKGWAKFMYGDQETLVSAGDCVHQRPGIVHYLFDYSPDMEYLEIVSPADFKTVDAEAPCDVPPSPMYATAHRGCLRILNAIAAPAACGACDAMGTHHGKSSRGPAKFVPRSSPPQ